MLSVNVHRILTSGQKRTKSTRGSSLLCQDKIRERSQRSFFMIKGITAPSKKIASRKSVHKHDKELFVEIFKMDKLQQLLP